MARRMTLPWHKWHALCAEDPTTARYRQLVEQETGLMSVKSTAQAHISYELIGEPRPEVVLIEFMNADIIDPRGM